VTLYELLGLAKELTTLASDYPLGVVLIVIVVLKCVEIAPIKINPLSWIRNKLKCFVRYIGGLFNSELKNDFNNKFDEVNEQIKGLEEQINNIEDVHDRDRIKDIRWTILDFANSEPKKNHDREDFDHIFDIHEDYKVLIKKHKLDNGKVDRAMNKVQKIYDERDLDPNF